MTNIESLPQEVLEFILSLVSPYGELKACALTCHRWNICTKNVIKKRQADFIRSVQEMKMDWSACTNATTTVINDNQNHLNGSHDQSTEKPKALTVGKRYSHSAVYDDSTDSMYIFGGCTSTATTFNDLWRLDLTTRRWHRPMATGTYPSPKACSVLVKYRKKLILFGGWTHPSMYPLHRWRLFNELHSYDLETSTWTQLTPAPGARENMEDDALRPPTMAGHSATIHRGKLIVFGGLQKQRNSIGQFSSSSDVWSFDLESMSWMQEDIPEPRPTPRYGQSQLYLDETHLLILGGCGGPSNIFNDVWLLTMGQPVHSLPGGTVHWKWSRCRVDNTVHGASHMWCHPAVKVGNFAVILGKNRLPKQNNKVNQMQEANSKQASRNRVQPSSSSNQHEQARWNVIPQLRRGVNRGYGAIRRAHPSSIRRASQQEEIDNDSTSFSELRDNASALNHNASVEPMAVSDEHAELSVIPIDELESRKNKVSESPSASESIVYRSQITMNINCDITESECKVDNKQSKSISEDEQSVETMETSQEIESLHTNTSQQNSKAARENQPSHAISYSTTTPNTIPENTFASARSISSESISPEKLVISVDHSTSMNNQAMALEKSNPSLNQNSFKKSNEEHEHQPNTSNSKSQTYSAQTSNVTPSSRSPKVSAISFNKNAAGQLGAGNFYIYQTSLITKNCFKLVFFSYLIFERYFQFLDYRHLL